MKYDRSALRATALDVKKAWEQSLREQGTKAEKKYADDLAKWEAKGRPETVRVLQDALAKAKKGQPIDTYDVRNGLSSPPSKPGPVDCCNATTKALDGLVEMLDTLADDEITANQLSLAGFKDVAKILRRPC